MVYWPIILQVIAFFIVEEVNIFNKHHLASVTYIYISIILVANNFELEAIFTFVTVPLVFHKRLAQH